jgi:hypothetical protein
MFYIKKIVKKIKTFIEQPTDYQKTSITHNLLATVLIITISLIIAITSGSLASKAIFSSEGKAIASSSIQDYQPTGVYPDYNIGVIYGKVLNASEKAISGTAVRINNTVIPTNIIGEFRFTFLAPGVYTIYYDAPGYTSQTQEQIVVTAGITVIPPTVIMSLADNSSNSNLVFYDYFDRPDGLLADHYGNGDPLNKWEVTSQSFYAKNSHGWTNSPVFRAINKLGEFSNFTLQAKMMKMNQGNDPWEGLQLFVRYQNSDNLYAVGLRNDNTIHIKKKVSGVYTTIGQTPLDTNRLGYWYKVKVVANGDRIQVFVDEVKYLDVQDSSFSEGKVGIRTDNIEAYFDDFIVTR